MPNSLTCSGMSGRGAVPKGHNAKDCHTSACLTPREACHTAEAFQSRWCHEGVLYSRPAEVTEQPHMHWTAAHPVPLS